MFIMDDALRDVRGNVASIRDAAKNYEVNRMTLKRRLLGNTSVRGRPRKLNEQEELVLVDI